MKKNIIFINLVLIFICFSQSELISSDVKRQRIISLAPSTTEILFSIGLDNEIVGVSSFCNFPSEATKKEKVGTFSQPNVEKIILLKPDIIFATGLEQAYIVGKLKQLRLNVHVSDPSNIEELFASIEEIGRLTYRERQASELINYMKTKIKEIKSKVKYLPHRKRLKVFIEIWHDPLMTAGRGSFVDELINLAGGENIAYDTPRPYSYFSSEQVIKRNPDCIILGYMDKEPSWKKISERLGWGEINAVVNKRIYNDINPDLFLRPGPRIVEGLEKIYNKLYPK